jgi:hypothetical protein
MVRSSPPEKYIQQEVSIHENQISDHIELSVQPIKVSPRMKRHRDTTYAWRKDNFPPARDRELACATPYLLSFGKAFVIGMMCKQGNINKLVHALQQDHTMAWEAGELAFLRLHSTSMRRLSSFYLKQQDACCNCVRPNSLRPNSRTFE